MFFFFFFQAEDGIRDLIVTGVQTCALPIFEGTDRLTVQRLAGIGEEQTLPEAYTFAPPVSPHLGAKWANVEIDVERLQIPAEAGNQSLVVEGTGGVLVPI